MGIRSVARACTLVLVVALGATGCGDDGGGDDGAGAGDDAVTTTSRAAASSAPTMSGQGSGGTDGGVALDAGTLSEPPVVDGAVTAAQADAVVRTVLVAWMRDDRARAERFVAEPAVLDALFARRAPSTRFSGDDDATAYCTKDDATGSYENCSYGVVDQSPDGILAIAGTVRVGAGGRLLVVDVGFADWND